MKEKNSLSNSFQNTSIKLEIKHKQDRQCTYNLTFRHVHETIVAVKKQKLLHISVCVCVCVCVCLCARARLFMRVGGLWVQGSGRVLARV
jgi:hypothetical protein